MEVPPPSSFVWHARRRGSVQDSPSSLFQAEGRTCEDFRDEDHYSSSPNSSFSPFDDDLSTTSSSLSVDSLTTEGTSGEEKGREAREKGLPPWSITVSDGDYLGK